MPDDDDLAELEQIRLELRDYRNEVDDPDLREAIHDWLDESHERVDADTIAEFMNGRLTQMLSDYEMFYSSEVDSPGEAFPDDCSDCRHYGSACPVLVGPVEPEFRERRLAEAETESQQRQVFQQQAIDTGCKRIPEFLEEWDEEHADFVRRGDDLLYRAQQDIQDPDDLRVDDGGVEV
ncbi:MULTISPECIES: hypothetical protein [Salinibaculum]|uniref:hypothetical protein n=1 Tax=Salinibaculum TaxID=2732368 RepID=UPI0030CAF4AD